MTAAAAMPRLVLCVTAVALCAVQNSDYRVVGSNSEQSGREGRGAKVQGEGG